MMKMRFVGADGKDVLILGLSHKNLDNLRERGLDGGIKIEGKELGLPVDVWITAAPDEQVMLDTVKGYIDENTDFKADPILNLKIGDH